MVGARTVGARTVGSGIERATPAVVAMTLLAAIARTFTRLAGVMTVPAQSMPQNLVRIQLSHRPEIEIIERCRFF